MAVRAAGLANLKLMKRQSTVEVNTPVLGGSCMTETEPEMRQALRANFVSYREIFESASCQSAITSKACFALHAPS